MGWQIRGECKRCHRTGLLMHGDFCSELCQQRYEKDKPVAIAFVWIVVGIIFLAALVIGHYLFEAWKEVQ